MASTHFHAEKHFGHIFKLTSPDNLKCGTHRLIINLSKSLVMTEEPTSVLKKGLSYIPTPSSSKNKELLADMQAYYRRLKLEVYFEGKKNQKMKVPFTHPSDWEPILSSLPKEIEKFIRADNYAFKKLHWGLGVTPNLTLGEKAALKELQNNTDIVILDRKQYIGEGLRQLSVMDHYLPLYTDTVKDIESILEDMLSKKIINAKQKEYLTGLGPPRPRRFYLLPKIHKEPEKWSVPF